MKDIQYKRDYFFWGSRANLLFLFYSLQTKFWGADWYWLYKKFPNVSNKLRDRILYWKLETFSLHNFYCSFSMMLEIKTIYYLSNIPTDCFLLFQTKPVYFLLIPWLLTELTGFHYLRSNGKNHIINNYVKGNENERLFTFLFFKFINLKFSRVNVTIWGILYLSI